MSDIKPQASNPSDSNYTLVMDNNKVYEHANDLHVRTIVVYVKESVTYTNRACTKKMSTSQLKDAFIKGCIVSDESKLYRPLIYKEANGIGEIEYATVSTSAFAVASASAVADSTDS